jgi:hypothetical protein
MLPLADTGHVILCTSPFGLQRTPNISWLTDWLTNSMQLNPSWETNNGPLAQELPNISWNPKVHYSVFTRPHNWSLSWVRLIWFTPPYPTSLRYILILFSNLQLGLPSELFPSGFPTKILHAFLFFPMSCAHHTPWLDHSVYISSIVQIMKVLII